MSVHNSLISCSLNDLAWIISIIFGVRGEGLLAEFFFISVCDHSQGKIDFYLHINLACMVLHASILTIVILAALPPLLHHRAEDFNCLLTFIQEELERESDMEDDHLEAPDETSSNDVRDKYDECTSPQRGSPTENSHKAETNINTDSVLPERHSDGFYVHWLPSRSGLIAIGVAILASIAIYYVYS